MAVEGDQAALQGCDFVTGHGERAPSVPMPGREIIAAKRKQVRAAPREDWYVVPARDPLREAVQPDAPDAEPRMLLVHPDRLALGDEPRRKLPRRVRGVK